MAREQKTPTTASPDGVLRTAATNEQKKGTHLYTAKTKRRGLRRGATAEKGPEGGPLVYNATGTPQPPRGAGGAPEA